MNTHVFATKGNLIQAKKSLALALKGYELMDKKRNVLIKEMMELMDKVKLIRNDITAAYELGYYRLQQANMSLGVITNIVTQVPVETDIYLTYRSVMGVEVPIVKEYDASIKLSYGLEKTNSTIDEAFIQFQKVKELTLILAEVDNSVYRLANAIRKAQKRANALKNIVIPQFQSIIKHISEVLEEKEREEFTRLKVIKNNKLKEVSVEEC